jgi:hypothetical protein
MQFGSNVPHYVASHAAVAVMTWLTVERMGRVLSREIPIFQGADVVGRYGRQYRFFLDI